MSFFVTELFAVIEKSKVSTNKPVLKFLNDGVVEFKAIVVVFLNIKW